MTCRWFWLLVSAAALCAGQTLTDDEEILSWHGLEPAEQLALQDLYTRTNGDAWTHNRGWLINDDPCTWYGILCGDNHTGTLNGSYSGVTRLRDPTAGHVLEINLPYNNLVGPIPESISEFTQLRRLYLNDNWLTTLPVGIGALPFLEIARLMNNVLANTIPPTIGNLTSLKYLSLARNQLVGTIPASIVGMQALEQLYLNQNYLTGPLPAPLVNRSGLMPRLKQVYTHKNPNLGRPIPGACSESYCSP